ncbi:MAG TPA: bacteriohopanetetrol glucosamine biosynthesis glycosyltransferase HpnI, partial [Thermomicrobiales bacterium]|nr:bacteriohopanetetrol glucosamine biosynthesis glycosyltransferase HpnI [Thermomicrobiales bacterium]
MNPEMYIVPLHWLGELCAAAAIFGIIHLAVASILILRFRSKRRRPIAHHPSPVSILVPLCGEDTGLYERLAALCRQDYAAPIQLICGVQAADDPAIAIVKAVAGDFPGRAIDLQIDAKQHGGNRKISNLINMSRLARHNLFVIVDSDILVGPTYLSDVAGALRTSGAGAVSCLYHGISGAGSWSALSSLSINTHFLPGVVTALAFRMAQPCFGATIALSRSMLATIGGLQAFADCLHDDYAIGAGVHAAGYDVVVPNFSIGHVCREHTARELLLNQMRYARTIKMIDPVGYAGSVVTHPAALALIALL